MILATEQRLSRGPRRKSAGLLVVGVLLSTIAAVMLSLDPGMFGLVGAASAVAGTSFLAAGVILRLQSRRKVFWYADRKEIVESGGLFVPWRRQHSSTKFEQVRVERFEIPASKRSVYELYRVYLFGKTQTFTEMVELGDYESADTATVAAARIAIATGVSMVDCTPATGPAVRSAAELLSFHDDVQRETTSWWKRSDTLGLAFTNLIPVAGVLFAGWQVPSVITLYCFEALIGGLFGLLKVVFLEELVPGQAARFAAAGMQAASSVVLLNKIFVILMALGSIGALGLWGFSSLQVLLAPGGRPELFFDVGLRDVYRLVAATGVSVALLLVFASHAFSFVHQYLREKEYKRVHMGIVLMHPVCVLVFSLIFLHLAIAAGAALHQGFLMALVLLKFVLDVHVHRYSLRLGLARAIREAAGRNSSRLSDQAAP